MLKLAILVVAIFGAVTSENENAVRGVVLEFAEHWTHATDPAEIATFYSEDATHINPQGEWVETRDELVGYFAPLVSSRADDFAAEFTIERIAFTTDEVALVDGAIEIRGMRGPDGEVRPELYERFTFVMKKTGDRWEIAASRVMFPETR